MKRLLTNLQRVLNFQEFEIQTITITIF